MPTRRIESQPQSSGRRAFFKGLAMAGGALVGLTAVEMTTTKALIVIKVDYNKPSLGSLSGIREYKRTVPLAGREPTPEERAEEAANVAHIDALLAFDGPNEIKRKQMADQAQIESDNTPIIGQVTKSKLEEVILWTGTAAAIAGVAGMTRADRLIRRLINFGKTTPKAA